MRDVCHGLSEIPKVQFCLSVQQSGKRGEESGYEQYSDSDQENAPDNRDDIEVFPDSFEVLEESMKDDG